MPEILVYVAVCNPSAKFYFGITSAPFERRVNRHLSSSRQRVVNCKFHKAICKYGADKFTWSKVTTVSTWEEACEIEKYLIQTFDTTNDEFGYNTTSGGDGSWGKSPSESTREKISVKLKAWHRSGDPAAAKQRETVRAIRKSTVTLDSTRAKISLASTKRTLSAESRAKLSESKRKYTDELIAAVTSEAKVIGFRAAERKFGIPRPTISRWLWSSEHLEVSRQKARVNSKKWYHLNHLSPCSSITGPKG
jgi:group I intron endonuclease